MRQTVPTSLVGLLLLPLAAAGLGARTASEPEPVAGSAAPPALAARTSERMARVLQAADCRNAMLLDHESYPLALGGCRTMSR